SSVKTGLSRMLSGHHRNATRPEVAIASGAHFLLTTGASERTAPSSWKNATRWREGFVASLRWGFFSIAEAISAAVTTVTRDDTPSFSAIAFSIRLAAAAPSAFVELK